MVKPGDSLCEVNLKLSRIHLALVSLSHVVALLALWLCAIGWVFKCLIATAIAVHFYQYHLRYIAQRHATSISAIRLFTDRWLVQIGNAWYRAWPEGEVIVTAALICCKFRVDGKRHRSYLILFPDSADHIELHDFRLRLLLESNTLFGG